MTRLVTATLTRPTGTPLEGELLALAGALPAHGVTDAGGGVVLDVEAAVAQVEPYTLTIHAPVQIDGVLYLPGTILRLEVPGGPAGPDGGGPLTLAECIIEVVDASPAPLLARIAALEATVALLTGEGA